MPSAHPSCAWWLAALCFLAVAARCCMKPERARSVSPSNKLGVRRVPGLPGWIRGGCRGAGHEGRSVDLEL
jgi:hypothetical protein